MMTSRNSNARIGLWLFAIYLAVYCLFVLLNAFAAKTMEQTPIAGVNLAIIFGFGLIVLAFVLALIYGFICKPESEESATSTEVEE